MERALDGDSYECSKSLSERDYLLKLTALVELDRLDVMSGNRFEDCPICLGTEHDEIVLTQPCYHAFHIGCLRKCPVNRGCPSCRRHFINDVINIGSYPFKPGKLIPLFYHAMKYNEMFLANFILDQHVLIEDFLISAVEFGRYEMVEKLLRAGISANIRRKDSGKTPLHYAAVCGALEIIELLHKAGANVNAADASGYTPLHAAAGKRRLDVVQELLARGANTNIYGGSKKRTPLDIATQYGSREIVTLLAQHMDLKKPSRPHSV